jgi:LPXTG-site transpeptidase (sortase) family protein
LGLAVMVVGVVGVISYRVMKNPVKNPPDNRDHRWRNRYLSSRSPLGILGLALMIVGLVGIVSDRVIDRQDALRSQRAREFQDQAVGAFDTETLQSGSLIEHHEPSEADDDPVVQSSSGQTADVADPAPGAATSVPPFVRSYGLIEPIALLEIPKIGLSQVMVEGDGTQDMRAALDHGPAHYNGMALPGQPGNVGVAGHRTTVTRPFHDLDGLVPGDEILFTYAYTENGAEKQARYRYVVTGSTIGSPADPNVQALLGDWGDSRVTLTTCHPRGSAAQRLVVTGVLVL